MKSFLKARGMSVATLAEGATIGKFDDFLFDLETHEVYGYRLRQGVLARSGGVAAGYLRLLGRDLVFVTSEAAVDWSGVSRGSEDGRAWASRYRGTRVMSRRGANVGVVDDFLISTEPHEVHAILLDGNRVLRLDERVSVGRDSVVVDEASAAVALEEEPETTDWWDRVKTRFGGDR